MPIELKESTGRQHPVRDVQFTLDGTRDVHNRLRLYHKPDIGTYDTIVRNMEAFAAAFPETQVNLRIHVSPGNIGEFEKVCADIAILRQRYPNINPYPGFITDYRQNCVLLDRQKVSDFFYDMYNKGVYMSGFYPKLKKGGCCATAINSYVVGAEGELYKCWVDVGDKQRAIGTVMGITTLNEPLLADYMVGSSMYDDPECRQCMLMPVCDGGCTIRRLRRDKDGLATDLCPPLKNDLERNLEIHYETKKNEKRHERQ
ncbi:MAG: SPASM domain-containing protein [Bacteroidales bacterium]|nr:SPASM domain-containing protein [Bacteroidales bacterium]